MDANRDLAAVIRRAVIIRVMRGRLYVRTGRWQDQT